MAAGDVNASQTNTPQPNLPQDNDQEELSEPTDINIAMKCAMNGNVARFVACFDDAEDPFHETIEELLKERDDEGKSPLDMAALLGQTIMMKELISRGAEVNEPTSAKQYTAIHHAAAWGKIECLKALVECGASLQAHTANQERPRDIALRYNQTECVDYLDWAEAKALLLEAINSIRETVTDPEKVQGRLSREEKSTTVALCNEKSDWIENTTEATTQDFIAQKLEFDEAVSMVAQKLSEPLPEKPEKK